jgi:hypothetical protein
MTWEGGGGNYVIKKQELRQLLGEKCKKINIPHGY